MEKSKLVYAGALILGGFLDSLYNVYPLIVLISFTCTPLWPTQIPLVSLMVILVSDWCHSTTSVLSVALTALLPSMLHLVSASVFVRLAFANSVLVVIFFGGIQSNWTGVSLYLLLLYVSSLLLDYKTEVQQSRSKLLQKDSEINEVMEKLTKSNASRSFRPKLSTLRSRKNSFRGRGESQDTSFELDSGSESSIDFHASQDLGNTDELDELIHSLLKQDPDVPLLHNLSKLKVKLIQQVQQPVKHSKTPFKLEKRKLKRMPTTIEENEAVCEYFDTFGEWNFDTLGLGAFTTHPLFDTGIYVFTTMGIKQQFSIPSEKLCSFMQTINEKYRSENFYHNAFHAADVTNSTVFLMKQGLQKCGNLLDLDIFALVTAAMCHDISHPGLNNAYLISTQHSLAMKYNDQSVLENMHTALTFKLLSQPQNNILATLSKEDYLVFRKILVSSILSTDLQRHFEKVNEFRAYLDRDDVPNFEDDNFRVLCLQVVLKCADLGHGAKTLATHKQWSALITKEFFAQGDKQKQLGFTVDALFDRERNNLAESQIGFLKFLVKPIFDLYVNFIVRCSEDETTEAIEECIEGIEANLLFWITEKQLEEQGLLPTFALE